MNRPIAMALFVLACVLPGGLFAQNKPSLFDSPRSSSSTPLFDDRVVARGKNFQIKQSQVDELFIAFRSHRAAIGQEISPAMRPDIEADILDRLIATQLFLGLATEQDKLQARQIGEAFIAEQKKQALSEESFRRQLIAVGMTPDQFSAQIHEQAVVKAVIDRELRASKKVSDEDVRKFYDENPILFKEPERVRASHILISTRDSITGKPLAPELKLEKKRAAERILKRVRAGEDFAKLAREFSDDTQTKESGGEYTFARARDNPRQAMVPEFEAAAFSMTTNQISDLVETAFGYHIIKLLGKTPEKKVEFAMVQEQIRDNLLREDVEKDLPAFISKLREQAEVEILSPGKK
jgi:peptidyl-prolyl cis-trans isomerase C